MKPQPPLIDIHPDHWAIVRDILLKHVPQYEVWAFGSRATRKAREFSDLDLAIITDQPLSLDISASLHDDFSESDLPWKVDVVDWATTSESFRKIIERDKVVVLSVEQDMGSEWRVLSLEKLAAKTHGSIAVGPFGSRMKADLYVPSGVRVIRGNNLGSGSELKGEFVHVTSDTADGLSSCCLNPCDLVFPHRGNIGEVGITPDDGHRYMLSTSLMKFSPDRSQVEPLYLFYFFKSSGGKAALLMNSSQVGTPGIATPLKSLKSVRLPLPPLRQQRAITHILGTLDDKVELNRKQNETLETMARALFKAWFVDFEPVRAKLEGRWQRGQSLPGLPAHLYDLFPDRLVESELGEIPEGWEYKQLSKFIEILDSKRVPLSSKERAVRQGTYPYHGATGVMGSVDDYLFDGIHVLLGEDGSVARENGRPFTQYAWGKFWVNNHAHVLRGWGISSETLLLFLDQCDVSPFVTGAVQLKLSQGNLKSIPFLNPGEILLGKFGELIAPIFDHIRDISDESRSLAELRDTLLPKLISGELRLADVEQPPGKT